MFTEYRWWISSIHEYLHEYLPTDCRVCTRTHSPDDHTRCQSDNRLIGFENFQRDISWIRSCHRVRNLNQWIHSKFMNYDSEFWSCPFSRDHWSDGILPLDDLEALWSLKFRQAITSLKNRLRSSFWFLSIYFQFLSIPFEVSFRSFEILKFQHQNNSLEAKRSLNFRVWKLSEKLYTSSTLTGEKCKQNVYTRVAL